MLTPPQYSHSHSHPVHSRQYHSLSDYHLARSAAGPLSRPPFHETSSALLEREGVPSCSGYSLRHSTESNAEHMSNIPPVSGPPPTDAHSRGNRGSLERKRRHVDEEILSSTTEHREFVRSRPLSWQPSTPVEPPLGSSQHRSIGVNSILNHPATEGPGVRTASVDGGRESLGEQMSPDSTPSHSRFSSSSSTVHLPSPSMHTPKPAALSPGMRNNQGIAPISPSARLVGTAGYFPPKAGGPGHSPLAQQLPGVQSVAPGSPLPVETSSGHPPPISGIYHHHHQSPAPSTSAFASHRASTNHTPTPSSKESSPTTPVPIFNQLGRSSPALSAAPPPQPAPTYRNSAPYATVDPVSRLPASLTGQSRSDGTETPGVGGTQSQSSTLRPGMIPCFVDMKSGSSSQAEKRKANSDASRRFRNRKRNEMQMEQKITSQQDEIRKQAETIQKQAQELQILMEQREFYRSERDYFREQASHFVQTPARPRSPHLLRPKSEATGSERETQAWAGSDAPLKVEEETPDMSSPQRAAGPLAPAPSVTSLPGAMPGGRWSAPSPHSSAQVDRLAPDERQARPMPPTPGTWNRPA